jgi:putative ABC transport system substrate-binding protein
MNRRDLIGLLGGAAAWPLTARAQGDRVRRVAVVAIGPGGAEDAALLREELQKLGWREGRNLRLDVRIADDGAALRVASEEVVKSGPEVICALTGAVAEVVQTLTRTIPIVFVGGGEAVGRLVNNVARPEGNSTGFANLFGTLGGKWLELLKEIAPRVTRVAILFNPDRTPGNDSPITASAESAATRLGTTTVRMPVRNRAEIEREVEAFAAEPNGALIIQGPGSAVDLEGTVQPLAMSHRLPVVSQFPGEGVLIAYGADLSDLVRGAASYIDRILRGAKPDELPVQYPTRFRLVINLKAAKVLGLTVPPSLLAIADEVIE